MDREALLERFADRVDQFSKYRSFISKAQEQSGKFATAVVEKVVADNESKSMEIVGELIPMMSDIESVIEDLRERRAEALDSSKESQFRLEELELRLAIGDLSEEDFNAEASEFKAVVENTETRVSELDNERIQFEEALSRWQELGSSAGVLANGALNNGRHRDHAPSGELLREPERYASHSSAGGGGSFATEPRRERVEYESAMPEPELDVLIDSGGSEPIEAFDAADDDADGLGFDNHVEDGFDVEDLDLVENGVEPHLGDSGLNEDKPRRAVLLYQEGTAEEQIYPFTGEVMSLGRGRDNDVQVKNDSKVSRYHCKLYRRGPNFYIEDNKSANGTLVNGELITERRLFGGEEVIIGETFFRFRILD